MQRPADHEPEQTEKKEDPPFTSLLPEEEIADWRITEHFVLGFLAMIAILVAILVLKLYLDTGEMGARTMLLFPPLVVLALLAGKKKWAALGALAALLFVLLVTGNCFLWMLFH